MGKQSLIIRFSDQSTSFTNGVELGRILQQAQDGKETLSNSGFPVHVENTDVISDTCKHHGYVACFGNCDIDGWTYFIGLKSHRLQ